MRFQNRLVQLTLRKPSEYPKHLLMHPIEDGPNFDFVRVFGGIDVGHRSVSEQAKEVLTDQVGILGLLPTNAFRGEPVLGKSQLPHLPGDMADPARRLSKPIGWGCLIERPDRVVAGEGNLLDGKLQLIRRCTPFLAAR